MCKRIETQIYIEHIEKSITPIKSNTSVITSAPTEVSRNNVKEFGNLHGASQCVLANTLAASVFPGDYYSVFDYGICKIASVSVKYVL